MVRTCNEMQSSENNTKSNKMKDRRNKKKTEKHMEEWSNDLNAMGVNNNTVCHDRS